MLVSTIQSEIITEVGGDTSDTALATKVLGFMNSALRKFPLWTRSRFMYAAKTATLSSGDVSVSLPTGFINERDVYYISEGTRLRIEKPSSTKSFNDYVHTSSSGAPEFYQIVGQTVYFNHAADKDYTIYFECAIEQDGLETGDTVAFDSMVVEILKDGAKYNK
jgi:hypothetical protein